MLILTAAQNTQPDFVALAMVLVLALIVAIMAIRKRFFTSDTDIKIIAFGKNFHVGTVFVDSAVILVMLNTADRKIFPESFIQFAVDDGSFVATDNVGGFAVLRRHHKAENFGIKGDLVLFLFVRKAFNVGI